MHVKEIDLKPLIQVVRKNQRGFWWLHSAYSLILGIGVIWLGARDFRFLKSVIFNIPFIWLTGLLLSAFQNQARLGLVWSERCDLRRVAITLVAD